MSFRIGGFLDSLGGDNQISTSTPTFAGKQTAGEYEGGSLMVTINRSDTQQTFAHRGLHDHAIAAGLNEREANKFAEKWTNNKTILKHYTNGNSYPYTPTQFDALKTNRQTSFELSKEYDADVLADLNARVEENRSVVAEESFAYTPEERQAMIAQRKGANQNQTTIADKPEMILTNGLTKGGKPLDADTALGRYIEKNYNQNGRVWGDKINEMVAQAKTEGVAVDLKFNEDGTALVGINASDKQKLDKLFNQALGETIKGEQASDEGEREGTRMALDIPITLVNSATKAVEGVLNIPSALEDLSRAEIDSRLRPAGVQTLPIIDRMIPKVSDIVPKIMPQADLSALQIPNQSGMFNKDANGKINPNGQTLGKTAATITGFAIPFAFGDIVPAANPNELTLIAPLRTATGEMSAAKIGLVNVQTELDPLIARQFGKKIADNPVATRAYSQMQRFGTEVKLDFGTPRRGNFFGEFEPGFNRISVFMKNNDGAKEAVATMVHETSHGRSLQLGRPVGSQMDEFRAFTREFVFKEGRRPTLLERRGIWQQIQRDYSDMPVERNPFTGRKP